MKVTCHSDRDLLVRKVFFSVAPFTSDANSRETTELIEKNHNNFRLCRLSRRCRGAARRGAAGGEAAMRSGLKRPTALQPGCRER
jgi:hypothetical protein